MPRRLIPFYPALIVPVCLGLSACLRNDGLASPYAPESLPLLAGFEGKAVNEGDTTLSARRFIRLTDPKLVLVWQSIVPQSHAVAFEKSSVKVTAPYQFSVELRNPPPREVQESNESVIGSFWLYSDGDGNDRLDRLTDPEVQARLGGLDSLKAIEQAAIREFKATADIVPHEIPVHDSFLVESSGTLIRAMGGILDTLYAARGNGDERVWFDVVHRRYAILRDQNAWERFFELRKKTSNFFRDTVPVDGHAYSMVYDDRQKLFPLPGREAAFRSSLRKATLASVAYYAALYGLLVESAMKGWSDYPYTGFEMDGQDWVAGRSRFHFLLYFPDRKRLETLLEAERGGSFRVDNIDRMRVGYNLLNCDQDYRCRVLPFADSILIYLGETNAYFDPPSLPAARPVKSFEPVRLPPGDFARLQGVYDYQPFRPIQVLVRNGMAWCDLPDFGLQRLYPVDSTVFFVPGEDLQFEFIPTTGDSIGKLIFYSGSVRSVARKTDLPPDSAALSERIDPILGRKTYALPDSVEGLLPQSLEFGADTAELETSASGDTLYLRHRKLPAEAYGILNDSQALSRDSEKRLGFRANPAGKIPGMSLSRMGKEYFLPSIGYAPQLPVDEGGASYSLRATHPGSGRDSYRGLGGRHRYTCPDSNGLFLRQGDGMVLALRKSDQADSISLKEGGDALLFRLDSLAGKTLRLELTLCAESGVKSGRLMFAIRAGAHADSLGTVVAESHWVTVNEKGGSLVLPSVPVASDPYFVEISQTRTLDRTFPYAFGSYAIHVAE
jgi:hypothetical protein